MFFVVRVILAPQAFALQAVEELDYLKAVMEVTPSLRSYLRIQVPPY